MVQIRSVESGDLMRTQVEQAKAVTEREAVAKFAADKQELTLQRMAFRSSV